MNNGGMGMFGGRGGRGSRARHSDNALSSQPIWLSPILYKSHYPMKNMNIFYFVQIGFLICTVLRSVSRDWQLWARYRSGPR